MSPGCEVLLGLLLAVHGMRAERVDFAVFVSMPELVSYREGGKFSRRRFLTDVFFLPDVSSFWESSGISYLVSWSPCVVSDEARDGDGIAPTSQPVISPK